MKLLSTYLRGKSLTVCFAFPEDYDMANIDDLNVSIGSKQFTGDDIDISGQVACVRLKSEDTYKLTGDYPIIISIDDKTRGVIPIYVGDIRFVTHRNSLNNASTNEQNDIVIALSITQTTIDVDSVLYDVMAGKAATIEVGTVTTLDAGEDATIENIGTENEAVFNFGIPKGDKGDKGDAGDMFSGQFNTVILKQNCVWVDGWLWIDTGSKLNPFGSISTVKKIDVGYMAISTGIGTEQLKPIVHYPSSTQNEPANQANGFYLKDADGRLSENTDFEHIDLRYNILPDNVFKYDGLTTLKKGGFVLEENAGEEYHSRYGIFAFDAVYPEYTGVKIESRSDPLTMTYITQHFTPTYCRKRNVNLISKPYHYASITENVGSNADILSVASHYGNTFERRDITANETTFLQNVIAVGSCGDGEPDPDTWTSYGFGLEFSERGNNLGLNADYPTETFPHVVGYGTGSGNTFTDSVGTRNYENMLQVEIGARVKIGLTYETAEEYTLAGLSGNTFTTEETFALESGTNYVYIDALIGTAWQTAADNQKYYQSPVCSIVAAKFRKIQDVTGASWDTIRLACRATASNGGTWDMYRGFGVIDVDAAIQYIKDNYTENEDYLNNLADEVDRTRGIDPMLPYEKQTDDTPIAKRDFEPVRDKLAGIEDNANNYVHPGTHPPAIIEQDANNRFVTDAEKSTWNGKQNDLGFTPENAANKQNSLTADGTGTKYPTVDAVNDGLGGKEDSIGYTTENVANKQNSLAADGTGVKYPTVDTLNANFRSYTPTIPYANRVLADSGVISDIEKLTKLYIENLKLLDNTVFLWDGSAGIKTRTSGANTYATKLYDMSAGNRDAVQATEANQPHISGIIAPNEQRKLKGLTGETGTKGVTGTDIQIASSGAFTLAIAVKWNYPRTSSRIYLSATNYIELTAASITLRGDSGNVLTCSHNFRAGLTEILTFEYSNGAGLIRVNGIEKTTTATSGAVTFGSLFLNQTSYNFDGEISKLQIANVRLSAAQIQSLYNFTRLQHPEIEGVAIGNQFWATSNYEGVVTGNGTVIPEVQDSAAWAALTTPAWCYYNNDPLNGAVYGKLYNWYAVQAIAANPPSGWRVPTDADFNLLVAYLGGNSVANGKIKIEGTVYWKSPNTGATNESGLSSLGAGQRTNTGIFTDLKSTSRFWSLGKKTLFGRNDNEALVGLINLTEPWGASIRLIRNEPVGATERSVETGYITNALGATNLDIPIPFGYQVESIRFDSETNITGLSAKLLTGALVELEPLFTAKSVTANVQKVIAADADQSIQQTDAVVRINGTKALTSARFRVWVKLTKVVFS